jgi:hypothetical protein
MILPSTEQLTTRIVVIVFSIAVIAQVIAIVVSTRSSLNHVNDPALIRKDLEYFKLIAYGGISCAFALGFFISKLMRR